MTMSIAIKIAFFMALLPNQVSGPSYAVLFVLPLIVVKSICPWILYLPLLAIKMSVIMRYMAFSESRFWTHVGLILIVKIAVIFLLWYVFFGPGHRMKPDALAVQQHLTGKL
jgi:hypothetical protein